MVQSDGCNHIIPVDLYINGHYRGSYNFTEKVGFSNNSIDIADESNATMLELDSYYDEAYKFKDTYYKLPVNVKEPDFDEPDNGSFITFEEIKDAFNNFTYDTKEDFAYLLLFAMEQNGLSRQETTVQFSGLILPSSEIIDLCRHYVKNLIFVDDPHVLQVSDALKDVPFQYYYTLYHSLGHETRDQ
jgi:hypothetical protein